MAGTTDRRGWSARFHPLFFIFLLVLLLTPSLFIPVHGEGGGDDPYHKVRAFVDLDYAEGESVTGEVKAFKSLPGGVITDTACTINIYVTGEFKLTNWTRMDQVVCRGQERRPFNLGKLDADNYDLWLECMWTDGHRLDKWLMGSEGITVTPAPIPYIIGFLDGAHAFFFDPLGGLHEGFTVNVTFTDINVNQVHYDTWENVTDSLYVTLPVKEDYLRVDINVVDVNGQRNSENRQRRDDGSVIYPPHGASYIRPEEESIFEKAGFLLIGLAVFVVVWVCAILVKKRNKNDA